MRVTRKHVKMHGKIQYGSQTLLGTVMNMDAGETGFAFRPDDMPMMHLLTQKASFEPDLPPLPTKPGVYQRADATNPWEGIYYLSVGGWLSNGLVAIANFRPNFELVRLRREDVVRREVADMLDQVDGTTALAHHSAARRIRNKYGLSE